MTKPSISHEEATIESLRKNPDLALAYLNDVLEDGDEGECLGPYAALSRRPAG